MHNGLVFGNAGIDANHGHSPRSGGGEDRLRLGRMEPRQTPTRVLSLLSKFVGVSGKMVTTGIPREWLCRGCRSLSELTIMLTKLQAAEFLGVTVRTLFALYPGGEDRLQVREG